MAFTSTRGGDFLELINRLPPSEKSKFSKIHSMLAKEAIRVKRGDITFSRILEKLSNGRPATSELGNFDLIGLKDEIFRSVAPTGSRKSYRSIDDGTEICQLSSLMSSDTVKDIDQLRREDIHPEEIVDHVWDRRLRPLVSQFYSVSVVDPYALALFLRASNKLDSGLGSFIYRSHALGHQRARLEIVSSMRGIKGGRYSVHQVKAEVLRFIEQVGVKNIQILIADNELARAEMHPRYFLAGQSYIIDVDLGLEMLAANQNKKLMRFAMQEVSRDRKLHHLQLTKSQMALTVAA